MKRDRSYRRHQRERIINHRLYVYYDVWGTGKYEQDAYKRWSNADALFTDYHQERGRFAKYNLSCNCWLCKYEKKAKVEKRKYKVRREDFDEQL